MRHGFRRKSNPTDKDVDMNASVSRAIRVALLCTAGALASTAAASPVQFTINSGSWTLGTGWGLACPDSSCDAGHTSLNATWALDASLAQTFFLATVGDMQTINFGTATLAEEDNKIDSTEQDNLGVTATLDLTAPTSFGSGILAVVVATSGPVEDNANDLSVLFDPVLVPFGAGGEFSLKLSDSTWNCNPAGGRPNICQWNDPETRTITATFTLTKLPTSVDSPPGPSAVPEPGTLALFGIGIVGLGYSRRNLRTSAC